MYPCLIRVRLTGQRNHFFSSPSMILFPCLYNGPITHDFYRVMTNFESGFNVAEV